MKLTDALLGEHGVFYPLFDEVEKMLDSEPTMVQVRRATALLAALVGSHGRLEDELLLPALEPHLEQAEGPLAEMRAEHEGIARVLSRVEAADDVDQAILQLQVALGIFRDHFRKEETAVFPMAQRVLDDATLTRLGRAWAEARGVALS